MSWDLNIVSLICRFLFTVLVKKHLPKAESNRVIIKSNQIKSNFFHAMGRILPWISVQRPIFVTRNKIIEVDNRYSELSATVKELEKTLHELRIEVSSLLSAPENKSSAVVCGITVQRLENSNTATSLNLNNTLLPAVPLPPPAPPLPPSPVKRIRVPVTKSMPRTEWERDNSFLEELSKRPPKLRHVERSPGGRPVRLNRSPVTGDPVGLSAVLKKRYLALHSSPRLSLDQCASSPATAASFST